MRIFFVEKAVEQEEKDEKKKKRKRRERSKCGNNSYWPWPALIDTKNQSVIDRNSFLKQEPIKQIMCVCVWETERKMGEKRIEYVDLRNIKFK